MREWSIWTKQDDDGSTRISEAEDNALAAVEAGKSVTEINEEALRILMAAYERRGKRLMAYAVALTNIRTLASPETQRACNDITDDIIKVIDDVLSGDPAEGG